MSKDPFWAEDFSIIYRIDRIKEYFPSDDMSLEEKLNSISRFSLYLGILLYLYNNKSYYFYIPIFTFGGCYYFYNAL